VGRTLVRLSAHAGLADNDVKRILGACRALRPRLGEQATASAG
jgi:CAI-1 autoinducer synthase